MKQVEELVEALQKKYKIDIEKLLELYQTGMPRDEMAVALDVQEWTIRTVMGALNCRLAKKYRAHDYSYFLSRFGDEANVELVEEVQELKEDLNQLSKDLVAKEVALRSARREISKYRKGLKKELGVEDIELLIASSVERIATTEPTELQLNLSTSTYSEYTQFVMLSDLHMEQSVFMHDVGNCNEYSWEIAEQRLGKVFSELLNAHRGEHTVIVGLLGDMLDGLIHNSLETANKPLGQAVADLALLLANYLKSLAAVYAKVTVPCISGNHERNTDFKRSNNGGFGFAYLLYNMIKGLCSGYPNIELDISTSGFTTKQVGSKTLGFTHGDYIRGFGDIKILKTKEVFRQTTGVIPDNIFSGHTHKAAMEHMPTGLWITNGSLIGVNAYSHTQGFMGLPWSQTIGSLLPDGTIENVRLVSE